MQRCSSLKGIRNLEAGPTKVPWEMVFLLQELGALQAMCWLVLMLATVAVETGLLQAALPSED